MNFQVFRSFPAGALLFLLALVGAAESGNPPNPPGTITGVVLYTGVVPPPKKFITTDGGTIVHSDLVVDPKTKGLRDVVAILENVPAQPKVQKAKAVLVDQRDMMFLPRVVAVQNGQAVRFENNDLCNHSVMALSKLDANQFNRFANASSPFQHVFEPQKHPVQIACSLHGWMRAWVYVVPHPWFAVSDTKGEFTIEGVPPGKYTLWLRHQDSGHQDRRTVEVRAKETTKAEIEWKKAAE